MKKIIIATFAMVFIISFVTAFSSGGFETDLAVENFFMSPEFPSLGEEVTFTFDVVNVGTGEVDASHAFAVYGPPEAISKATSTSGCCDFLAPGERATKTMTVIFNELGDYNIQAVVNPEFGGDQDLTNNFDYLTFTLS